MVTKKVKEVETIIEERGIDKDKISPRGKEVRANKSSLAAGFESYEKNKHKVK